MGPEVWQIFGFGGFEGYKIEKLFWRNNAGNYIQIKEIENVRANFNFYITLLFTDGKKYILNRGRN